MVVKIRLARFGRRHAPFYNIVVCQARTARDSKPMEVLGTYDPIPKPPIDGEGRAWKDIKLDSVRARYWLGVGAQPSDTAWRILSMAGLLEPKFRPQGQTLRPHTLVKSVRFDTRSWGQRKRDHEATV
ncbi:ribosomal protein S16 domain-containing protein [Calycina marina]|uniref:Ribosomal protein S16 domain-containing protein n=1 Tax=Calycina marina TaxID=1763456 RepID=A0A9P7Z4A9_9HELO|nr:ribosomal protein S16 domain-containing protein [Calycina marina]